MGPNLSRTLIAPQPQADRALVGVAPGARDSSKLRGKRMIWGRRAPVRTVNTMRRDYFAGADRSTADAVLEQLPAWFTDYNVVAPHSALGYKSPQQYRTTMLVTGPKC